MMTASDVSRTCAPAAPLVFAAVLTASCSPAPGPDAPAADARLPSAEVEQDEGIFGYYPDAYRLEIGETVPEIPLRRLDGEVTTLSAFRGKVTVLAFVGASDGNENDDEMLRRLGEFCRDIGPALQDRVHVLTLVLDEASDVAAVRRVRDATPAVSVPWTFLGAAPRDAGRLAAAFGVVVWQHGDGRIGHSFNTVVIDPAGRLADHFPGLGPWSPRDLTAATSLAAGPR
jgi:cytochrome oxidase Cu insertion factor (SCO1/SenC/PrrC family)